MTGLDRMAAVAATEFRLAFRNRWVLLATLAFTLFALALAFLGSGPSGALKADALTLTAASLSTLTVYLVPLMALLVSYDSIAGEIERGTLALVLATPVKRGELVLAKFCGHLAVLGPDVTDIDIALPDLDDVYRHYSVASVEGVVR